MQLEKTIVTLEVTENNTVIIREKNAVMIEGTITDEDGKESQGLVEKNHWFEHREIKAGDDYSQESDKVKAICKAAFAVK